MKNARPWRHGESIALDSTTFIANYAGKLAIVQASTAIRAWVRAKLYFNVPNNKEHHLTVSGRDGRWFDSLGQH